MFEQGPRQLTWEEREAVLNAALPKYVQAGWRVIAQTGTTASLARPRQFDPGIAFASFLLCGFGLLIYIAAHFAHGDDTVLLIVDEHGQVKEHVSTRR